MDWVPFEGGATIGQSGSEQGTIVSDEEYANFSRITLEKSASAAPFAITCGVYGWALHTRFFRDEAKARSQYEAMKTALRAVVDIIPLESDPDLAEKMKAVTQAIQRFVAEYP